LQNHFFAKVQGKKVDRELCVGLPVFNAQSKKWKKKENLGEKIKSVI